jgi:hypothetical protein
MSEGEHGVVPTLDVLKSYVDQAKGRSAFGVSTDASPPDLALMGFGTFTLAVGSLPKDFSTGVTTQGRRHFIVDDTAFMASAWCKEGIIQFVSANSGEIVVKTITGIDYLDI